MNTTSPRYCAWYALGGNQWVERHSTVNEAIDSFRETHRAIGFDTITREGLIIQQSTMDLYPVCSECNEGENYHDYPTRRYVIGPRSGVARERV